MGNREKQKRDSELIIHLTILGAIIFTVLYSLFSFLYHSIIK